MFTRPIRLPVISTKDLKVPKNFWGKDEVIIHTQRGWHKRTGWHLAETIDQVDEHLWGFARMLMRRKRWLMIHAASIPATQAYWQECQKEPADYSDFDNPFD